MAHNVIKMNTVLLNDLCVEGGQCSENNLDDRKRDTIFIKLIDSIFTPHSSFFNFLSLLHTHTLKHPSLAPLKFNLMKKSGEELGG